MRELFGLPMVMAKDAVIDVELTAEAKGLARELSDRIRIADKGNFCYNKPK